MSIFVLLVFFSRCFFDLELTKAKGGTKHDIVVTIGKTVGIERNTMAQTKPNDGNQVEASGFGLFFLMTLAVLVSAGGTLYFLNDKLGAIAMIPLALGACLGYRSGAWKMLSMLLGSACGYYLAAPTAVYLVPFIESSIGRPISNPSLGLGLSGIVAGSAATVFLMVFGWLVIYRNQSLKALDQNLGMVVGVTKSSALVAIGLWTVLAMEPHMINVRGNQRLDDEANSGTLYHRFLVVAQATRSSPVLAHLVRWNPIATNPMLNDLVNRSQAMVRDVQSQAEAARSGHIPAGSKLTGLFSELQSQGATGKSMGSKDGGPVVDSLGTNGLGSMLQRLVESQN